MQAKATADAATIILNELSVFLLEILNFMVVLMESSNFLWLLLQFVVPKKVHNITLEVAGACSKLSALTERNVTALLASNTGVL